MIEVDGTQGFWVCLGEFGNIRDLNVLGSDMSDVDRAGGSSEYYLAVMSFERTKRYTRIFDVHVNPKLAIVSPSHYGDLAHIPRVSIFAQSRLAVNGGGYVVGRCHFVVMTFANEEIEITPDSRWELAGKKEGKAPTP